MVRTSISIACAVLWAGCPTADDDDDAGAWIDLEGVIVDPMVGDAGVADAWIVVDTGDELFSARTGADGSFSIPALPADQPIALTVAGDGRMATTRTDVVLADEQLPMQASCSYRSMDYYDLPRMTVSGTLLGAPVGSWVLLSGPGMTEYPYVYVETIAGAPFEFTVDVTAPDEPYLFSALALDGGTGERLALGTAEVDVDEVVAVDVELVHTQTVALTVTVGAPLLDGEPLEVLDSSDYQGNLGIVYLGDGYSTALGGWTSGWSADGDGFAIEMSYLPAGTLATHASLYLVEDFTDVDSYAYAYVPFPSGDEQLTVDVLDSPALDGGGDFTAGDTLTWAAIDGASRYALSVVDGDALAWRLYADEPSFAFPRMPEGFDTSLILDGDADVLARAMYYEEGDDGDLDWTRPYLVSETPCGTASF